MIEHYTAETPEKCVCQGMKTAQLSLSSKPVMAVLFDTNFGARLDPGLNLCWRTSLMHGRDSLMSWLSGNDPRGIFRRLWRPRAGINQ